jgi:RNA polymerase sigma factor (sigma-70 family)
MNYLTACARTVRIPSTILRDPEFKEFVTISTDSPLSDESNASSFGDTLEADEVEHWDGEDFNEGLDDAQYAHRTFLRDKLSKLNERDRLMVSLRYTEEFTLQNIADEFGCSKEYVRQKLERILKNLRIDFGIK